MWFILIASLCDWTSRYFSMKRTALLAVSLLILIAGCFGYEVVEQRYFRAKICGVGDRIGHGCAEVCSGSFSLISCAISCTGDDMCVGSSIDGNGLCYKHFSCPSVSSCTVEDDQHVYSSKMCDNGGLYEPGTTSCQCVDGWMGATCQEKSKDCTHLFSYGLPQGSYHTYLGFGGQAVPVYCYVNPSTGYHVVTVLRQVGNTHFNLTWEVYRRGFFHAWDNLWMGLENWHKVSNEGHYTEVVVALEYNTGTPYRCYFNFVVQPESSGYSFTHGYQSNYGAGDCFSPYAESNFSTWDRDNCAATAGHGWWFDQTNCDTLCNLFGRFGDGEDSETPAQQLFAMPGMSRTGLLTVTVYLKLG